MLQAYQSCPRREREREREREKGACLERERERERERFCSQLASLVSVNKQKPSPLKLSAYESVLF